MLALRYRGFWATASVVLVVGVIWASLQTAYFTNTPHGFDKVEHFSTYLFLAVWFTGLYARARYWRVVCGLLALGAGVEITQYLMRAGRIGDPYDMAANTGGIVAGLLLAMLITGGWAQKVERWLR